MTLRRQFDRGNIFRAPGRQKARFACDISTWNVACLQRLIMPWPYLSTVPHRLPILFHISIRKISDDQRSLLIFWRFIFHACRLICIEPRCFRLRPEARFCVAKSSRSIIMPISALSTHTMVPEVGRPPICARFLSRMTFARMPAWRFQLFPLH